jgi:hypothetical protein
LRAEIALSELEGEPLTQSNALLLSGAPTQTLLFDSPPLRRWWPWDQGEPYRYRVTVRLLDEHGPVRRDGVIIVGVRTVAREGLASGAPMAFHGQRPPRLPARGELGSRGYPARHLRSEDYARQIGMAGMRASTTCASGAAAAREAGVLGRVRPPRRARLAGVSARLRLPRPLPARSRPISLREGEARAPSALRNHPSLLAWCGGNEIKPATRTPLLRTIERVSNARIGRARGFPLLPSTATSTTGTYGTASRRGGAAEQAPPFMSEFGLQALPDAATARREFPDARLRSTTRSGLSASCKSTSCGTTGPAHGRVSALVDASQRVQAAACKPASRRAGCAGRILAQPRPCGGVAFWQFNEPWRAVSWSVVDRNGRPKAAYKAMLK